MKSIGADAFNGGKYTTVTSNCPMSAYNISGNGAFKCSYNDTVNMPGALYDSYTNAINKPYWTKKGYTKFVKKIDDIEYLNTLCH